ncbi:MAG TPA: Lrp/AsnC ligand binding domain-containing protein [Mycobacteriales bacterium]|jgi:DNA-binding Lrp family transcriptional regulator|nr:Lrp/AsnC ligand binding domain-containing protein [Mycobacteriales bacterium]
MVQAYVLVEVDPGRAGEVNAAIAGAPGVLSCAVVTGPYDVVVHVSGDDVDSLSRAVESFVRSVDGVTRTITCPIFHL